MYLQIVGRSILLLHIYFFALQNVEKKSAAAKPIYPEPLSVCLSEVQFAIVKASALHTIDKGTGEICHIWLRLGENWGWRHQGACTHRNTLNYFSVYLQGRAGGHSCNGNNHAFYLVSCID